MDEKTQFRFTTNPLVKALLLPNFTTSHEGLYTTTSLNEIQEDTLMDMPALFEFPNKTFMAITEAALLDYAGMYLIKKQSVLYSQLSPLPDQKQIKVKATFHIIAHGVYY
jgi:alpha-glucosidase